MADFTTEQIRTVALVGHGDSGKTSLAESMLFRAGAISRKGSVNEQSTVSDFETDEKHAGHSIDPCVMHVEWHERLIEIVDTPGYPDYIGAAICGMSAVETAIVTVGGPAGVMVNTRRVWKEAGGLGCGRIIVVTKVDQENVDVDSVLEQLRASFGDRCVPANLPNATGAGFKRVVSMFPLAADVPAELADLAAETNQKLTELIIEADEELLMRYLEGDPISPEELGPVFSRAIRQGTVVPVLFCASSTDAGVGQLLDFIALNAPSPAGPIRPKMTKPGSDEVVERSSDGPFAAQVFKLMTDDFVGKISFLRVWSGEIASDSTALNPQTGKTEKVAQIYRFQGKEQKTVPKLVAGMIGALTKLDALGLGDTLCAAAAPVTLAWPSFPNPMVSLAVEPKSRGDEGKIGSALARLADVDPTFSATRDKQTKELVISGISTLHLETMLARLKERFKVEVTTKAPRIPYLETITTTADVEYTHKKQSGGAGQFARIFIKVEPNERGAGYEFVDEIVGGVIDHPFRGSVDKGIQAKISEGVYAGYPVVDVRVRLYDGKTHPVDSKDIAFQIAGREAFKKAILAAKPSLLEPIVELEVTVPARFLGDITGDLNSRRGRILGMDSAGDLQTIRATVPLAEVASYSTELKSITGGEGSYALHFSHYDIVPANIAAQIAAKAAKEEE